MTAQTQTPPLFTLPNTRLPSAGSRLLAIAEAAVLLGLVELLYQFGILDPTALPVHPFLFVVMLMSAQYGASSGIATAVAATTIEMLDGLPLRLIDQPYFDYVLSLWSDPLVWIASSLVIGVVTTRHLKDIEHKSAALETARAAETLISEQYEILAQRTRRLERRVAGLSDRAAAAPGLAPTIATDIALTRTPLH